MTETINNIPIIWGRPTMSGPKGLINLSDPPSVFRGFVDGQRVWIDGEEYIYRKGKGSAFDTIVPVTKDLVHDPSSKSG